MKAFYTFAGQEEGKKQISRRKLHSIGTCPKSKRTIADFQMKESTQMNSIEF
jgi:hypothetical protein